MSEKRSNQRTAFRSRIRITHDSFGTRETYTRDVSDSGVFIYLEGSIDLEVGVVIEAQVLNLPGGDGNILSLEVVRKDPDGVGLKFI